MSKSNDKWLVDDKWVVDEHIAHLISDLRDEVKDLKGQVFILKARLEALKETNRTLMSEGLHDTHELMRLKAKVDLLQSLPDKSLSELAGWPDQQIPPWEAL